MQNCLYYIVIWYQLYANCLYYIVIWYQVCPSCKQMIIKYETIKLCKFFLLNMNTWNHKSVQIINKSDEPDMQDTAGEAGTSS